MHKIHIPFFQASASATIWGKRVDQLEKEMKDDEQKYLKKRSELLNKLRPIRVALALV